MPEALCHRCHPALIAAFKSVGDWCVGHDVPESQCAACNPTLVRGGLDSDDAELPRIRRAPDPTCTNEQVVVKLDSPETARNAGLRVVTIEKRPVSDTITCNAEITFARDRYARVSARVPAVVHRVERDLGDRVVAGDVLAILDSVDLGVAKAEFLRLLATAETSREKVERAEAYLERLNRLEVQLTAVELLKAREVLAVSRKNAAREERLMQRQSASEKALLDARAELSVARASVTALEKKLILFGISAETVGKLSWQSIESLRGRGTSSEQEVLNARIDLRAAETGLQAARRRLLTLGLTDVEVDVVARTKDTSSYLALVAPFDGEVVELSAVMGEVVDTRKTLFAIADTSKMWVVLDIYARDLLRVRPGQLVAFTVDGLRGETFRGILSWVSAKVDGKTRTIRARSIVDNDDGLLRAEMFGKATVTVHDADEPVVVVPKEAVQWEGCCNVVFIRLTDTLYQTRKVRLGLEADDVYVVEDGLSGGESVVTTGSFLLKTEILKGNIGAGCGCVEGK